MLQIYLLSQCAMFLPRKFTKLLKPVHSSLKLKGHILAGYIDDNYIQGDNCQECLSTVLETVKLVAELGFCVHPEKSCLIPAQEIVFLGNVLNSVTMTRKLTDEKKLKIKKACKTLQRQSQYTIREVAKVIGLLVSNFTAIMYGPLYYKALERDKSTAVKDSQGNYDGLCHCLWRLKCIKCSENAFNVIEREPPSMIIYSDASTSGWGAVLEGITCGGHWSPQESEKHINCLESMTALFSLQALAADKSNTHIRLKIDNTTAVAAINDMGTSHSLSCKRVAIDIWKWSTSKNIWVSAEHIAEKCNTVADSESREICISCEWMLNSTYLHQALDKLESYPDTDMFASRLNAQFSKYISYRPDPGAQSMMHLLCNGIHFKVTIFLLSV